MAVFQAYPGCCAGILISGFYGDPQSDTYTYGISFDNDMKKNKHVPFMQCNLTSAQLKQWKTKLEQYGFKELGASRGAHGNYKVHIYVRFSNQKGEPI